jgi:hypothetical protein
LAHGVATGITIVMPIARTTGPIITGGLPIIGRIRIPRRRRSFSDLALGRGGDPSSPEHDPEKWVPVFPRDKRQAFARRSCSNKKIMLKQKIERDDDSKKSHHAQI